MAGVGKETAPVNQHANGRSPWVEGINRCAFLLESGGLFIAHSGSGRCRKQQEYGGVQRSHCAGSSGHRCMEHVSRTGIGSHSCTTRGTDSRALVYPVPMSRGMMRYLAFLVLMLISAAAAAQLFPLGQTFLHLAPRHLSLLSEGSRVQQPGRRFHRHRMGGGCGHLLRDPYCQQDPGFHQRPADRNRLPDQQGQRPGRYPDLLLQPLQLSRNAETPRGGGDSALISSSTSRGHGPQR